MPSSTGAAADESGVYFHHQAVEEALPRVKGYVGWYWLKTDSVAATERVPKQIDAMFENSPFPTKTETEKEFQNGFVSMLGNVKAVVTGISTAIALVILLISANTMAMAARERVTEIAVLRTLGYPRGTILALILGEGVLLGLFGGLLGLGLFALLYPGFRRALQYSPMGGFAAGMGAFPDPLLLGVAFPSAARGSASACASASATRHEAKPLIASEAYASVPIHGQRAAGGVGRPRDDRVRGVEPALQVARSRGAPRPSRRPKRS